MRKIFLWAVVLGPLACGDGDGLSSGTDSGGSCGAKVGESCNPDSCGCEAGPNGAVVCRLDPDDDYQCIDETPQNKQSGAACTYNFECTSEHCYTLTSGDPRVCQDVCVPEGTAVPYEHTGNVTANCCGGFSSCSNGSCTCG